jgi:hypothetical protein
MNPAGRLSVTVSNESTASATRESVMATECVSESIPSDADVTIKILRRPGGRRLRIVVEHDTDLVESVSVASTRIDPDAPPGL